LKVQLLFLGSTSSFVRRPATALLLKKRRRAEYRLPPHSKFFRQTCEAPGGTNVCLTGGGRATVSERRTPNAEVKNSQRSSDAARGDVRLPKKSAPMRNLRINKPEPRPPEKTLCSLTFV